MEGTSDLLLGQLDEGNDLMGGTSDLLKELDEGNDLLKELGEGNDLMSGTDLATTAVREVYHQAYFPSLMFLLFKGTVQREGLKVVAFDRSLLNGKARRFFNEFCPPPVL
jgi:poly(3-hydroxyalkanoate) synthetase